MSKFKEYLNERRESPDDKFKKDMDKIMKAVDLAVDVANEYYEEVRPDQAKQIKYLRNLDKEVSDFKKAIKDFSKEYKNLTY